MSDHDIEYGRVKAAVRRFGLSRSGIYKLGGEGLIDLVKAGSTTLVNFDSVRRYIKTLPAAPLRGSEPQLHAHRINKVETEQTAHTARATSRTRTGRSTPALIDTVDAGTRPTPRRAK